MAIIRGDVLCNKMNFETKAEANKYIKIANANGNRKPKANKAIKKLHAYHCQGCGQYHLTSVPKTVSKVIKKKMRRRGVE